MSQALQFLNTLLHEPAVETEFMKYPDPLSFETVKLVASKYGYSFTTDELNDTLSQSPDLVAQLQTLIDQAEIELDEAEMALIAGGGRPNCDSDGGNSINASLISKGVF